MSEKTIHEYKRDSDFIEECGFYEEVASSSDTTTLYPVRKVLWSGRTKATDNVLLAESPVFGKMLFLEGELQSTEADEAIYHEHLIHPAMALARIDDDLPSLRVLVLGGGEGATVRELLRYPSSIVREIVWVDIDKDLVNICREKLKYVPAEMESEVYESSGRVIPIFMDAMDFLRDDTLPYFDLIILDLPDPNPEAGTEELYGEKFWSLLGKRCNAFTKIVTHCGPVGPTPGSMEIRDFCYRSLAGIGYADAHYSIAFGMVAIPSFQSEWGFLIMSPNSNGYAPVSCEGLSCLKTEADCQRFWNIPSYYPDLPKLTNY